MINRKFSLPILMCALLAFQALSPQSRAEEVIDRVVAVVNDDLITHSELRKTALSLDPTTSEQMDEAAVLEKMVEQKILEQEAQRLGITVSERELDASIDGVKQKFGLNNAQMEEVLAKQGLTMESFREQWKSQTLGNKLIESQLKNRIVITNNEIEEYYKQNYGSLDTAPTYTEVEPSRSGEEVEIAHILISSKSPNAYEEASQVAELAKSGNNFAELAREYSEDANTAGKGGNLGYFKKGDLIETLEVAIANTPEGKVSGPVESPAGYHILKVLDRKNNDSSADSSSDSDSDTEGLAIDQGTREEIRQVLYREKAEVQLKEWLDGIKGNAYVEVKL